MDGSCITRHFCSDLCICQKQSCVRPVCAVLTAGPDGFRKPSSLQQCGLLRPGHSAECLGFGGRLMHHHLAGLANSWSLFFSSCVGCVRFVAGEDRPDDPSGLVGHCDSRVARLISLTSFSPGLLRVPVVCLMFLSYDEPRTLSYQILLFGRMSADVRPFEVM